MSSEITMNWSMSPTIGKIIEALSKAQLRFTVVLKDSDNPAYKSKYADLATVIDATRPFLAAEGLAVVQMPHARFGEADAKELTLTTLLAHSSGEWITSDLTLPAMMRERFDAQSVGSAITYARRYALAAICGVAQEDDDGNKATGIGTKEAAQAVAVQKIRKAANGQESVLLVPWQENRLALQGHGVQILQAAMSAEDKAKIHITYTKDKIWVLPLMEGNMFASLCQKYSVQCDWDESQVEPGERE
jgi:ERF superfamily